jgi:hypothetical protein
MSLVAISGNASGTGTLTIAAPNTNSNRTLTLPDGTGTFNISGVVNEVPAGTVSAPSIYPTGDTNTGIFFPAADTIAFSEGGTERMRINSSGNVGIGTASPAYRLDVTGQGRATTGFAVSTDGSTFTPSGLNAIPNYGVGYITSTSQTSLSGFGGIPFYTSQLERMRINSSGNLLVGTTTLPSSGGTTGFGVDVNASRGQLSLRSSVTSTSFIQVFYNPNGLVGSIQTNGSATSFVTSSDYRLKNTIAPMTGALAKVTLLRPCTYKWNVDGSDGQGFIAHELAEVVPDCVSGEKDAVDVDGNPQYQGIDTSFLVATLTAAIQEQQALIIQLQADVAELKGATP